MRIVLRLVLTLILVLITAFCCFGFGASGEFKPDGLANPFRWLYGAMVVACVVAIVCVAKLIDVKSANPEQLL
jgi:hypothetical protein